MSGRRWSPARMVALYLLALAAVGAVAVADELIRHGLLLMLALAGPAATACRACGRPSGRCRWTCSWWSGSWPCS